MSAATRSSTLALQLIASLGDIVGEKALRSLVQYAAGEVGGSVWARSPPPRKVSTAMAELGALLGVEVAVVESDERSAVLRIATVPDAGEDPRHGQVREAVATGFYQGFERSRTGRTPHVTFAPPATLVERSEVSG